MGSVRWRAAVGLLVVAVSAGAGILLAASASGSHHHARAALARPAATARRRSRRRRTRRGGSGRPITAARPGPARLITRGPGRRVIALTFDDGFCSRCVARIIRTLARTGAHATIFPNGMYAQSWGAQRVLIRRLVRRGQLVIGNHTFRHGDAALEGTAALAQDLELNERWIERTFGTTSRPYFRPPYGAYNAVALAEAGTLGYTRVILWSGTVADSTPRSIPYILHAIRYWARPGAIILMHANYPATSIALPRILAYLRSRNLTPVTIDELLRGEVLPGVGPGHVTRVHE